MSTYYVPGTVQGVGNTERNGIQLWLSFVVPHLAKEQMWKANKRIPMSLRVHKVEQVQEIRGLSQER